MTKKPNFISLKWHVVYIPTLAWHILKDSLQVQLDFFIPEAESMTKNV